MMRSLFVVGAMLLISAAVAHADVSQSAVFNECQLAISKGEPKTLKRLITEHPEVLSEQGVCQETLLHLVAIYSYKRNKCDAEIVDLLISAGADPNALNSGGNTPLHEAAMTRSEAVSTALLRGGADFRLNAIHPLLVKDRHPEDGHCVIDIASRRGFAFLVEKLLAEGVPIEYPETQRRPGLPPIKDSALHFACRNFLCDSDTDEVKVNARRTVDMLCAKISDVNVRNYEGRSPLLVAADCGSTVIMEHLLTNYPKVDANLADSHGDTALHLVLRNLLSDEISTINKDHQFNVQFELLTERARMLVAHGAKVDITNAYGRTPLGIARQYGNPKLISVLEAKKAP